MGLSEYGDLGKAEIFTNSGMSVFNLFESTVRTKSGKKQDLEEVLFQQQYHTIYLMLGINELGYDYSSIIRKYQSLLLYSPYQSCVYIACGSQVRLVSLWGLSAPAAFVFCSLLCI